jgi:predicted phage terminase large subunit-like protein
MKDQMKAMISDQERKVELLSSLLLFTKTFFKILNGKEFFLSHPDSNESHFITVCREFTKIFYLENLNEIINLPPGWGKSVLCKYFVAWAMARYPDSNFIYISYSHDLAAKHTAGIKQIMELAQYKRLFGVELASDTKAKDYFKTTAGGVVKAFGSKGGITGHDAGLPNMSRFSGAVIMDDMHKPDEVHSDTIRDSVIRNYHETIKPRRRGVNVPFVFVGQRLHEDDLPARLLSGEDGQEWNTLIIKALDDVGNARYPEIHPKEFLLREESVNPYVFASQYQQNPQPAGGGIFKPEWFYLMDEDPEMLATFITADTAETDKDYNDASVFSFWGIYRISDNNAENNQYGLHWIDCVEIRVEPKDLEPEFMAFFTDSCRYKTPPQIAAIERKSTGVTLLSVLDSKRQIRIVDINRNKSSGSKIDRFLQAQPYVAAKKISLPRNGKHTQMCIEHMRKITANNSHRFDDIADTLYDAVKIALIDKATIFNIDSTNIAHSKLAHTMAMRNRKLEQIRNRSYYGR